MKKFLIWLLVVAVTLNMAVCYAADVPSEWAVEIVENAVDTGILAGDIASGYTKKISRIEFCELACNMIKAKGVDILPDVSTKTPFYDTEDESILYLFQNGIVKGKGENLFMPYDNITREELSVILYNIYKITGQNADFEKEISEYKDVADISDWAVDAVVAMQKLNIMHGDESGYFNPKDNTTKQEAIVTVMRMYEIFPKTHNINDIEEKLKNYGIINESFSDDFITRREMVISLAKLVGTTSEYAVYANIGLGTSLVPIAEDLKKTQEFDVYGYALILYNYIGANSIVQGENKYVCPDMIVKSNEFVNLIMQITYGTALSEDSIEDVYLLAIENGVVKKSDSFYYNPDKELDREDFYILLDRLLNMTAVNYIGVTETKLDGNNEIFYRYAHKINEDSDLTYEDVLIDTIQYKENVLRYYELAGIMDLINSAKK